MRGAGLPLVLLHEGFADRRMFDDQVAAFAPRYRVIRYDRHGSGRSGVPSIPYTDHAVLHDLLHHLGIERALVLGMSAGAGIALDFTLAYPAKVEALITVAPAVGGFPGSPATAQQWGGIGAALEEGDLTGAVELMLRMWVDGPYRTPERVEPTVRERVREMIELYFSRPHATPELPATPAIDRLREIRAPTLVLVGEADIPDILEQADLLHTCIAGAEKAVIPDVAHVLNMERPEAFNRLVLEFLDRLAGSDGRG
jgi:pimeloyl-ACP methyl ester carboxylesterase